LRGRRGVKDHINYLEYREMKDGPKPSKMRNIKTEVDGMIFDSQKEAKYYSELKLLKRQREIIDFFRQVSFLLQEGYWLNGEWVKPIWYKADFMVFRWVTPTALRFQIHEVKGRWTKDGELKRKMFEKRYPEYQMIII
jgi:hypothetical protein